MRRLIIIVARKNPRPNWTDKSVQDDEGYSAEEISQLRANETMQFTQEFSKKNWSVSSSNDDRITKRDDESDIGFVRRIVDHEASRTSKFARKLAESAGGLSSSTLAAINNNFGISRSLTDAVTSLRAVDSSVFHRKAEIESDFLARVPPALSFRNPIEDTNNILQEVTANLQKLGPVAAQTVELIASMNDTIVRMQSDYIRNAEHIEKQSMNATRLAAAGFVVSAIGLVLATYFSWQTLQDTREGAKGSDVWSAKIHGSLSEIAESSNKLIESAKPPSAAGSVVQAKGKP